MRLTLQTTTKPAFPKSRLNKIAEAICERLKAKGNYEVFVDFTSPAKIRVLNHDWRGKNRPTNVLSFPQMDEKDIKRYLSRNRSLLPLYLGDVILCPKVVEKEAKAQKKPVKNHFTHLVVHGVLHLLGYDHVTDRKAAAMERLEKQILADLGIPDPYRCE